MLLATSLVSLAMLLQAPDDKSALHKQVVKLVEVSSGRKKMQESLAANIEKAKKTIAEQGNCNAEFAEEWGKRMLAGMNLDDYANAAVAVYEKHLTLDEAREMTELLEKQQKGETAVPSEALKEKLTKDYSTIMSEIYGATSQLGAKLGADIGTELGKEHPAWCAAKAPK